MARVEGLRRSIERMVAATAVAGALAASGCSDFSPAVGPLRADSGESDAPPVPLDGGTAEAGARDAAPPATDADAGDDGVYPGYPGYPGQGARLEERRSLPSFAIVP